MLVSVSIAFSSGSSVDASGVAAADGGLVCNVDGNCVWRGVSCTWPAVMMLTVAVLAGVSDYELGLRFCRKRRWWWW